MVVFGPVRVEILHNIPLLIDILHEVFVYVVVELLQTLQLQAFVEVMIVDLLGLAKLRQFGLAEDLGLTQYITKFFM